MGGEIWAESEPGVGSTFYFSADLKITEAQSKTVVNRLNLGKLRVRVRVLIVEDNELNLELAQTLLNKNGIETEVATNGQEALDILDEKVFDGVLIDCQMPVMDGYTATRHLRSQERFKDLPILAMTANAMVSDIQQTKDAGMNDHIAKPIDVRQLFTTMDKLITPRMLESFRNSHADAITEFSAALDNSDVDSAIRVIHTLKGNCGAIGAEALQQLCISVKADLHEGKPIAADRIKTLSSEHRVVFEETALLQSAGGLE